MESDFLLALRLQEEWEAEALEEGADAGERASSSSAAAAAPKAFPSRPLSVVDESWELLDPNPDARGLFMHFNETLFGGQLAAVEVKWSPRMTLCAGMCCYEGRGGMCSIRLSEPLLKLRPRKDLVEVLQGQTRTFLSPSKTLLHEMIHALLFVTNNDRDRDSHGPEFCRHMHRINSLTGANITICHDFHDEVDSYRQHWWRCSGPCQNRKPYFGYVKRAMNRAPSANDFWWSEHQNTCGGTFTKIKEPENYSRKGKQKNNQAEVPANDKERAHANNIQSIIPFSGKGYVLGGNTNVSSSERTTSPSNHKRSQHHSPSGLTRLNPKNEQNVSFTNVSSSFSFVEDKKSCASSRMLSKVSVANKKVYSNVNGSPIKNFLFTGRSSHSSSTNAASDLLPKETPEKRFFEPAISTPKSHIATYGNYDTQNSGAPKRARMEDTTAFENYFSKKKDPEWTSPSVKSKSEPVIVESLTTSVSDEKRMVCCPVCQCEVLEAKINEHLDSCL